MVSALRCRLMLLPGLALVAVSALAIAGALAGSPAFFPTAREQGVFEDWRVPIPAALYKRSDYLFQIGHGYVHADLLASGATEDRDDLADVATALSRARRAEALLSESVGLAPADANSWASLGWARALGGNLAGATEAMALSWSLAPNSLQLAPTRLSFYALLAEIDAPTAGALVTDAITDAARRDHLVLKRYNPAYLALLAARSPGLAVLADETSVANGG